MTRHVPSTMALMASPGLNPLAVSGPDISRMGIWKPLEIQKAADAVLVPGPKEHRHGVHVPVREFAVEEAFRGSLLEDKPLGELAGTQRVH